ncbi:E3 ubiquitin-protein ligase DTX3L1 [Aulostomus maculatus]
MGANQSSDKLHCNRYLNAYQGVNETFGVTGGCQPDGQMTWVVLHRDLPGFPNSNTLQINYIFADGTQTGKHPHPGKPYTGLRLSTFLPDNREGRKVLRLLDKAFHQQLLFTVANSEDGEDVVSPASIPLKTQAETGSGVDGYPDPDYLKTVRRLLKERGIE